MLKETHKEPYYFTWSKQKNADHLMVKDSGQFCFIRDDHTEVWDLSSVSFQANFGLKNQVIEERIKAGLKTFGVLPPKAVTSQKQDVSKRLLDYLNLGGGKIFYTVSGAESVENALKIARQLKKAPKVLARKKSYHGATLGALSVTGDWRNPPHHTIDDWTIRIPEPEDDPDLSKTEKIIKDNDSKTICGLIVELVSGANGVNIPSPEYVLKLRELCDQYNIFLIADEIVTAFHRTGHRLVSQHFGVRPDFVCLAKAITGGFVPFGALWTTDSIAKNYENEVLCCGLTSYANPLGLSAMEGVLDILSDEDSLLTIKKNALVFQNVLDSWKQHSNVKTIRSIGHLAAIELKTSPTYQQLWDKELTCIKNADGLVLAPFLLQSENQLTSLLGKLEHFVKGNS